MRFCCFISLLFVCGLIDLAASGFPSRYPFTPEEEKSSEFWHRKSNVERERIMAVRPNINKAKNAILFLGDGMTTTTVTTGRILRGQLEGKTGEESVLAMDKMSYTGFSKTYCTDSQVSDSAATATAYLTGVKTNSGMLGLSAEQERSTCEGHEQNHVESFLVRGAKQGKSAGVVTTTVINHATPSGAYAHVSERNWYADVDLNEEARTHGCTDIASQLIEYSEHFDVVMGGGHKHFCPNVTGQPDYCRRKDGRDLVDEWHQLRESEGKRHQYVTNATQLRDVAAEDVDSLFGLFTKHHMSYDLKRKYNNSGDEPSLAEMTRKAIEVLQKNEMGFTLLVEGGRIDHAHHAGMAQLAMHDLLAFDDAIKVAMEMTSAEDTLIVVTADHGHTMAMGGYSVRGNPIFGLAPDDSQPYLAQDGKPFTTLLYANGPGYTLNDPEDEGCTHDRENLTGADVKGDPLYHQQAAVPLSSETHGGEDVGVYSRGPMSHILTGVYEQSYIAHVIMYATCIGEGETICDLADDDQTLSRAKRDIESSAAPLIDVLGFQISPTAAAHLLTFLLALACLLAVAFLLALLYVVKARRPLLKDEKHTGRI